jgi:YD repeat-containing protein
LDVPIDVSLPQGASQVFSFTAANSGIHKIFTGPYGGTGSPNDTVLELYGDQSLTNLLAVNDDANGTSFSEIRTNLTSGVTYYIKLRHYSSSGTVHARLTITYEVVLPTPISLDSPIDIDIPSGSSIFSFTPANPDYYRIFTDFFAGSGNSGYSDTMLYLYDDENLTKLIAFNDDYNGLPFSQIQRDLAGGKTYYIKMVGYNNGSVHARITVNQGTRNLVDIQINNPIDVTLPYYEFGYYRFIPTSSGNHRFYTGPYGGSGQQSDTVLYLYSDDHFIDQLTYNDDAHSTPFSEIKWELQAGTPYYIKLGGYGGGSVQARLSAGQLNSSYAYEYDDDNRLIRILDSSTILYELTYDGNGNLLFKRRPSQ